MRSLRVLQSHQGCQLQDLGRRRVASVGLTEGGVADVNAAIMANQLCGNDAHAAVLEISLGSFKIEAMCTVHVAVTGAVMPLTVNGQVQSRYQTLELTQGDVLALGYAKRGMRAYLAVRGGFASPMTFGSASTVVREQLGGLTGQALQAGDVLEALSPAECQTTVRMMSVAYQFQPKYPSVLRLDWVAGGQVSQFSESDVANFAQQWYRITPQADRMGYRLRGAGLFKSTDRAAALLSEGICLGAIQLPPDGQPIVLMPDHQTIGGYAKIGALTRDSVSRLSQGQPGTLVQFNRIDIELAQQQRRQQWQWLLHGDYLHEASLTGSELIHPLIE